MFFHPRSCIHAALNPLLTCTVATAIKPFHAQAPHNTIFTHLCTVATAIKPFHAQAPHNTIFTHLCTHGQPDVTAPAGTAVTSDHHHRNKQNYIPSHFLRLLDNRHAFSTVLQTWLVWQEKKHSCYASKFGQNCWTWGVTNKQNKKIYSHWSTSRLHECCEEGILGHNSSSLLNLGYQLAGCRNMGNLKPHGYVNSRPFYWFKSHNKKHLFFTLKLHRLHILKHFVINS